MGKDIHSGHRERMRTKFLQSKGEALADHELIELLLFYARSRKDTNPIAHELIAHFGSLSTLLEADPKEIARVSGVSVSTGILIALQRELNRRYINEKRMPKNRFASLETLKEYCVDLFSYQTNECFHMICLDNNRNLLASPKITEGTNLSATVYPKKVLETVLNQKAVFVIFTHNHPGGSSRPSNNDIELTANLTKILASLDVDVIDHIIVGDVGETFSFLENGFIKKTE